MKIKDKSWINSSFENCKLFSKTWSAKLKLKSEALFTIYNWEVFIVFGKQAPSNGAQSFYMQQASGPAVHKNILYR